MGKKGDNSQKGAPDFEQAAAILKTAIANADDQKAKALGDLSAAWEKVEENCHVNKKGAKFVRGLMNVSPATASDILRTVIGMSNQMGLGITRDMVDEMEGKEALKIAVIENQSVDV